MPAKVGKTESMRRLKRIGMIAGAVAVAIIAAGIANRLINTARLAERTKASAIPSVVLIAPQTGVGGQALVLPGDIRAFFEAPIYARVSGYLREWDQDIGAHVKAGQLLATIDTPELDQQLNQAKADLVQAQANLSLAELTSRRWQALVKQDAVSQQDADEKLSDAAAKKAQANAADANVKRLEALEEFKRIVAPYDGVVTARETDVGALINAGGGTGPELFRVADIHQMRIYVRVPQALSGPIKPGLKAELRLPQLPNRVFAAKVETTAEAINQNSRTMLVELLADNPDGALQPGTYAEVSFALPDNALALRIPASALLFRSEGLRVATVGAGDKVVLKTVSVSRDLGREIEIDSGLDRNDRVIASPSDSIAEGDVVHPVTNDKAAGNGS